MSNGKKVVEGVTYLAGQYCDGSVDGVDIVLSEDGGNVIHVYLTEELDKVFSDEDVAFMEALGFSHIPVNFDPDEEDAYSYFWLPL